MNLIKLLFLKWKLQKRRTTAYLGDRSNYNSQDYYSQTDLGTLYKDDVKDDQGSNDDPQFSGFGGGDGGGGGATGDWDDHDHSGGGDSYDSDSSSDSSCDGDSSGGD